MAPLTVGYLPFGLVLGAAVAVAADPVAAWSGTLPLYGGSAHLALLQALDTGATAWAAAAAAVLINVRLVVYSAALAPLFRTARPVARLVAAAAVIDPTWMVAERRGTERGTDAERRVHYAGAAVCLTLGWLAAVTTGALLGSVDRLSPALTIAVPLCLVALVAPHLRTPGGGRAVAAAVVVVIAGASLPAGIGILLAMLAAAAAGSTRRSRS